MTKFQPFFALALGTEPDAVRGYLIGAEWMLDDADRERAKRAGGGWSAAAVAYARGAVMKFTRRAAPNDLAICFASLGDEQTGYTLCLTRDGHGAGFWDPEAIPDEVCARLTAIAENLGGQRVYVSGDGNLHIEESN